MKSSIFPRTVPVQVGIIFEHGVPTRVYSITLIAGLERARGFDRAELKELLSVHAIDPVFATEAIKPDDDTKIFVNPDQEFIKSGPAAHSGMTGRKTASDTYGNYSRHSGSALSGKGPSRIDRVGVYAARYAAKNIVAADLAEACEVHLSYTVGLAGPVSVEVDTWRTGVVSDEELAKRLEQNFDFRLGAIVRDFNLCRLPAEHRDGFYRKLAVHGHLGASFMELPWEKTDKAALLR